MMKHFHYQTLAVLACWAISNSLTLSSCQQVEKDSFPSPVGTLEKTVSLSSQDGILIFHSWKDFYQQLSENKALNKEARKAWESSRGFESRLMYFEDILEAEESTVESYYAPYLKQGYTEAEIIEMDLPGPGHSGLYESAKQNRDILIFEDSDTASTYVLNSPLPYASLLNREGFVIVGDTLSHYLKGEIRHWIGGPIGDRHKLLRYRQSDPDKGILVGVNGQTARASAYWGTSSYVYRWVYESGNKPKRRAAYELEAWATDYGISNSNAVEIENWLVLHAHRKWFGKWGAKSNYRPDFHIAGNWNTRFGLQQPQGCTPITYVYTTWANYNNAHNDGWLSPIINYITPADDYAFQVEWLYPYGNFEVSSSFCELFRVTYIDINVHATGDGGGNLDLGVHIYSE